MKIDLDFDGPHPTPAEFARRLAAAVKDGDRIDSYGTGDVVQECERAIAALLGKERAVLFATGTLANYLALDRLCGPRARRVAVHPDAHVLNDVGDGAAAIMGLTLVTLPGRGPSIAPDDLRAAVESARSGRVAQGIGALCLETPYRRRFNQLMPPKDIAAIVATARELGVKLHLDGARLQVATASAGQTMASFCAPFDTVYLSLWKMLGLPFGSALAGPAALLDGIEHDRRRMGGGLPQFWPIASATLAALEGFEAAWRGVLPRLDAVREALAKSTRWIVTPIEGERTNTFWLEPRAGDPATIRAKALAQGLGLEEPRGRRFLVRANPTWLAIEPADLARRIDALA